MERKAERKRGEREEERERGRERETGRWRERERERGREREKENDLAGRWADKQTCQIRAHMIDFGLLDTGTLECCRVRKPNKAHCQ